MKYFAVITKVGIVLGAIGFIVRWPFGNANSFYLAWISVFGALEISTVPGAVRNRVCLPIIAGLLLLGIGFLAEGLMKI